MQETVQGIILAEVRLLREEVTEGFKEQVQRTTAIETKLEPLFDNGTPGTITKIEDDIHQLQITNARNFGWFAAFATVGQIVWAYIQYHIVK